MLRNFSHFFRIDRKNLMLEYFFLLLFFFDLLKIVSIFFDLFAARLLIFNAFLGCLGASSERRILNHKTFVVFFVGVWRVI